MGGEDDCAVIARVVDRDPSFQSVPKSVIEDHLAVMQHAEAGGPFLLTAMRCMALPMNGHTRLIPNGAIVTLPLRFVALGSDFWLVGGDVDARFLNLRLLGINHLTIDDLRSTWSPVLAGTLQRKAVIGALLCAWPSALSLAGVQSNDGTVTFRLEGKSGEVDLVVPVQKTCPALQYYPVAEQGYLKADHDPYGPSCVRSYGTYLRLADFKRDAGYAAALDLARHRMATAPHEPVVLDLRGNPGGDFLKRLDLIDLLDRHWRGERCAVLVDKFTFSAAIVFAALVSVRLAGRVWFFGEDMGDGLDFYAEGGTVTLPCSGAAVRYSDAHHDWACGMATATTPPEIAQHLVAAGSLTPDVRISPLPDQLSRGDDPVLAAARLWIEGGVE